MTHDLTRPTMLMLEHEQSRHTTQFGTLPYADLYAHAAECVREVAALRRQVEETAVLSRALDTAVADLQALQAENATLRAKAEIVDAMERGEVNRIDRTIAIKGHAWLCELSGGRGIAFGESPLAAYAQARAAQERTDG